MTTSTNNTSWATVASLAPARCPNEQPQFALTRNEAAWVEFLRLASNDSDPAPTLGRIQALRKIFSG